MYSLRTYDDLAVAWRGLRARGVRVREVACVGAPRTLLLAELGDSQAPTVSVSAGVHGDEPAGPWALVALVRDGLLDARFAYRIWPCLNPGGYRAGTRENPEGADINRSFSRGGTTPEARAVITANRDRRFVLALDLHEDFEASGTYLYEPLPPGGRASPTPSCAPSRTPGCRSRTSSTATTWGSHRPRRRPTGSSAGLSW